MSGTIEAGRKLQMKPATVKITELIPQSETQEVGHSLANREEAIQVKPVTRELQRLWFLVYTGSGCSNLGFYEHRNQSHVENGQK